MSHLVLNNVNNGTTALSKLQVSYYIYLAQNPYQYLRLNATLEMCFQFSLRNKNDCLFCHPTPVTNNLYNSPAIDTCISLNNIIQKRQPTMLSALNGITRRSRAKYCWMHMPQHRSSKYFQQWFRNSQQQWKPNQEL